MRPKACTTCRQWKTKCDVETTTPKPCSRCQSLNKTCVFDRAFKRTTRAQQMQQMQQEIQRLRRSSTTQPSPPAQTPSVKPQALSIASPASGLQSLVVEKSSTVTSDEPRQPQSTPYEPCLSAKAIGNVHFSAAQVTELFTTFFDRCHPHLPMKVCTSPETVFHRCPFLFWAICSAAMLGHAKPMLQEELSKLVAAAIATPPRSVEVVQAFLVLCMWPFPFYTTTEDPSLLYCGIAIQAGLQMGLHRPGFTRDFSSRRVLLEEPEDVVNSTWLACYIVSQLQASRSGVPIAVPNDFSFEAAAACKDVSPVLARLYRISRFNAQFNAVLGGSPSHPSGLMDPRSRLNIIKLFVSEFDQLRAGVCSESGSESPPPPPSRPVELALLASKLHLLSYAIRDDTPRTEDLVPIYYEAQATAIQLIQMAAQSNLSGAPHQIVRQLTFATFALIKIFWSPYVTESELVQDKIQLCIQTLSTAVNTPDDHTERLIRSIREALMLKDPKKTPPVHSRMAASLVFDCIRIRRECFQDVLSETDWSDLDGLDWQELTAQI